MDCLEKKITDEDFIDDINLFDLIFFKWNMK